MGAVIRFYLWHQNKLLCNKKAGEGSGSAKGEGKAVDEMFQADIDKAVKATDGKVILRQYVMGMKGGNVGCYWERTVSQLSCSSE